MSQSAAVQLKEQAGVDLEAVGEDADVGFAQLALAAEDFRAERAVAEEYEVAKEHNLLRSEVTVEFLPIRSEHVSIG